MRTLILAAVAAALVRPALAHELDFSLNSDAWRGVYATELRPDLRLDAGWLHDQDAGNVLHGGLLVTGEATSGPQAIRAGLGGRLVYIDGDGKNRDGYGLPLGARLEVELPDLNRVRLSAELYFAPDILTGGDVEEYVEFAGRVGYAVNRKAEVYLGARYVRADFDRRADGYFDTGLHIGLNLKF